MANHYDLCGQARMASDEPPSNSSPCRRDAGSPCAACVQLSEVNREVAEAKATLERVLKKKKAMEANVNAVHDPFEGYLPVEIACRILLLCTPLLPTIESFDYAGGWMAGDVPVNNHLTLGAVCRRWRQIVRTEPQFWKMIYLTFSPAALQYAFILEEWVQLSGNLPLFIYLRCVDDPYLGEPIAVVDETSLQTLLAHALNRCTHRWCMVHFELPSDYFTMLEGGDSKHSILHGIAISTGICSPHNGSFQPSPTPSPRSLNLSGFQLQKVTMDWSNLTRFTGCTLTLEDFLEVLRRAPRMTFCEFDDMRHASLSGTVLSSPPASIVHHTSLRELKVMDDASGVIDYLVCPDLQALTWLRWDYSVQLRDFIVRSRCSLKSLNICIELGFEMGTLQVLDLTPDLEALKLDNPTDDFLKRLGDTAYSESQSEGAFIPHLRRLEVRGFREFTWSALHLLAPEAPSSEKIIRRPLYDILLKLDFDLTICRPPEFEDTSSRPTDLDIIDKESLVKILDMIDGGFRISIEQVGAGCTIDASKKYYGLE